MRLRIAVIIIGLALGACTSRGYNVEPVVSPDDMRSTDVPKMGDEEGREAQDCFVVEIWAGGWFTSEEKEGVACMVEDEGGER